VAPVYIFTYLSVSLRTIRGEALHSPFHRKPLCRSAVAGVSEFQATDPSRAKAIGSVRSSGGKKPPRIKTKPKKRFSATNLSGSQ
jgi:hypothetical protein